MTAIVVGGLMYLIDTNIWPSCSRTRSEQRPHTAS